MTPEEEKIWAYLVKNPLDPAYVVARETQVPLHLATSCIDRIGTPRSVLAAKTAYEAEWDREVTRLTEGVKFDDAKPRYDLLPPELLEQTALVLTFGAKKYSARNWEKGMDWHRPFGALMRHMWAWWRGESVDPETGYSHLAHASCCLAFLLSYEARGIGTDNRPKGN